MMPDSLKYILVMSISLLVLVVFMLTSCSTTKVIPSPTDTHSEYREDRQRDIQRDTLWRERYRYVYAGDTIRIVDSVLIWRVKDRYVHDTIVETTTDTIHPEPIVITQESKRSGFDNFLRWSGGVLWGLIILIVIAVAAIIFMRITMR